MKIDEPRLRQLTKAFLEENAKLNLSAFRSEEHCWIGNILDSVAILRMFDDRSELRDATTLCDIGTGGGFPLLPLALCLPHVACTGMDSTKKKMDAVRRIVDAVGIQNVRLACGRVEEFGHDAEYRASFDLVTARALAPLSVLLEYACPLLRVGGICAFWKSTKVADELKSSAEAQRILRCSFEGSVEYDLPGDWGARSIVFFKKNGETPNDYPRKTGLPTQKPLSSCG